MTATEIFAEVRHLSGDRPLTVSLSGGNPALQPLEGLIAMGRAAGYRFALETQGSVARPWFAQWWIILPFVIMGTRGIWWIIPMVALWIWVIWPAIEQNRRRQQIAAAPMRPLTLQERDQVIFALNSGGDVAAIKRYRELTGADLYTATMTVKAMQRELGR